MARGWESKDVESQMEEARARHVPHGPKLSAEEIERQRKRENLLLSRKRVIADIEAASHPRHREMLKAALAYLDRQIAALDET